MAPRYQQASPAQKTLLLDAFVEWTGYSRKHAIWLLHHAEPGQECIQRHRLPQYGQEVQQALFLAWKAAHYVCAKRLLPSLPALVALLERDGHLHLVEEDRRQVLAMSVSTAERFLRTQRKPRVHGSVHDHPWSPVPRPRSWCARSPNGRRIAPALWKWIWSLIVGSTLGEAFCTP